MDIQAILVLVIFMLALVYVARMIYKNVSSKKSCESGCGKCGVDFSDVKPDKN